MEWVLAALALVIGLALVYMAITGNGPAAIKALSGSVASTPSLSSATSSAPASSASLSSNHGNTATPANPYTVAA